MSNLFICQELIDDVGLDFPENPQPQASRARQSGVFVVPCTPAADSDPYHADPSYADTIQQDSSFASYREQVYSWLMDFAEDRHTPASVVFMAINYFDRVLSHKVVCKESVELVALLCFYLASSVIERIGYQFTFNKLLYFFSGRYDAQEINDMLHEILSILKFQLNVPSPFMTLQAITEKYHLDRLYSTAYSFLNAICRSYHSIGFEQKTLAYGALYSAWYLKESTPVPETMLRDCHISLGSFYEITSILRNQESLSVVDAAYIYSLAQENSYYTKQSLQLEEKSSKSSPNNILACAEDL